MDIRDIYHKCLNCSICTFWVCTDGEMFNLFCYIGKHLWFAFEKSNFVIKKKLNITLLLIRLLPLVEEKFLYFQDFHTLDSNFLEGSKNFWNHLRTVLIQLCRQLKIHLVTQSLSGQLTETMQKCLPRKTCFLCNKHFRMGFWLVKFTLFLMRNMANCNRFF